MITLLKRYKIIILALVAVLLFASGAFTGYSYCKRAQDKGVIKQQAKDAVIVMEHQIKKDEAEKNVDTIITKLIKIKDTSGCLDNPNNDEYLNWLHRADSRAQSSFN